MPQRRSLTKSFLAPLLIFWASVSCSGGQNTTRAPLKISDILPEDYDKSVPPLVNGEPVLVKISAAILNLPHVDELKQVYGVDVFFHQYWKDDRVSFPSKYTSNRMILESSWTDQLWTPKTFFKNSLDGKVNNIIIPYSYTFLDNNGLFFAARVSLKLGCEMNLANYPHDVQKCSIEIMCLHHTNSTVVLEWKRFAITKNLLLAQYYVQNYSSDSCTKTNDVGTFSCLVGHIHLARRLGYFLINKYIPCVLIVCMSFVTFWIPAEAYPARVTLSVTSLLTIVTQQYQSAMPSVSYVVALNIWMLSCIGFVFLSLLEYAVIIAVMNQRGATLCPFHKFKEFFTFKKSNPSGSGASIEKSPQAHANHSAACSKQPYKITHVTIDRISRILFPLFFFLFCFSYWMVFQHQKEN